MDNSISVSVKSSRLKEEMHEFLRDLYRPWYMVAREDHDFTAFSGPLMGSEISNNTDGRCSVGFNYRRAGQPERTYVLALIRWMAIRIGRRKSQFPHEGIQLQRPVPYWIYDGLETLPILVEDEWPDKDPSLGDRYFDRVGMPLGNRVTRELAWYHLPQGSFERVTIAANEGKTPDELRQMFIKFGFNGAKETLRLIRAELIRLDLLWNER